MECVPNYIQEELFAVFGEIASYRPEGDCWYLPLIGVDPAHRGRVRLYDVEARLSIIDEKGLPAFLESSNQQISRFTNAMGLRWLAVSRWAPLLPFIPCTELR